MRAEDPVLEFDDDLVDDQRAAPATGASASAKGAASKPRKPQQRTEPVKKKARGRTLGRRPKTAAPRREKPKVTVRVVGLDRTFEAEVGTDLRNACRDNHVNLFWGPWAQAFNCRGVATCGLCKIEVVEGVDNLTPRTKKEDKRLRGKPDHWRLACHAKLSGDVRIDPFPRIPIDQQVSEEAIRRALMTEEERERLRENAKAERQAEREKAKGAAPAQKEKKGLLARFQKKGDKEGEKDKPRKDKPPKKGLRGMKKPGNKPAKEIPAEERSAEPEDSDSRSSAKPAKKGFGLKGRKS